MTDSTTVLAIQEHQAFVQRLARSLVRDPTAADDLAQDTWLSFMRRPPQAASALRSWLGSVIRNRASNDRRDCERRRRRETAVAPADAVPADQPAERLELQQRVVTAVLALAEPQRKALLLHYYDGMSTAAISAQLGVPAGTVRSRISRALNELRERLDRDSPNGRAGWLPGLTIMASTCRRTGLLVAAWLGATTLLGASTLAIANLGDGNPPPAATAAQLDVLTAPTAAPDGATNMVERRPATDAVAATTEAPDQDPQLSSCSIAELQHIGAWIQQLLRQRLLVADPNEIGAELAALKNLGEFGATRILRREWAEFDSSSALGIRGGGGYFSFVTKSHSYDDQPDLCLQSPYYSSSRQGVLMAVGDVPLAALDERGNQIAEADREAYQLLWRPAASPKGDANPEWLAQAERLRLHEPPRAVADGTYLLRRFASGERDALYAFRTVATDRRGHTLVYRLLRVFQAGDVPPSKMPSAPAQAMPKWLGSYDAEQLITLLDAVRAEAEPRLVAVPSTLRAEHQQLLNDPKFGICRVLQRGRFDAIVKSREGAAYFDFIEQTHHYDDGVHLGLANGRFTSGFAGNDRGYVVDLGPRPLLLAEIVPSDADGKLAESTQFVRDLRPVRDEEGELRVADKDVQRAAELRVDRGATAVKGHTYLVNCVHHDHAIKAAFHVLDVDADGATLLWHLIARDGR